MPVGYFFGFTDPTNSGDPCTSEFVFDNITHAGKRDGRYVSSTGGAEISYTVMHNVAVAFGAYGTYARWSDVTVLQSALAAIGDGVAVNRLDMLRFDGLSAELFMRVLERAPRQPFAATISIKPRWSAVDNTTGYPAQSYGSEFKLLTDVVLTERLFAAANFSYGLAAQKFDISNAPWFYASIANASAALTTQVHAAESAARPIGLCRCRDALPVGVRGARARPAGGPRVLPRPDACDRLSQRADDQPGMDAAVDRSLAARLVVRPVRPRRYERHEFRLKFATPVPLPAHWRRSTLRDHRQHDARRMRGVMVDGVGAHLGRMIGVVEHAVGHRRVALAISSRMRWPFLNT